MILKGINRIPIIKKILSSFLDRWVKKKCLQFTDLIPMDHKILDLGSGNCLVAKNLMQIGYDITPIDVKDMSVVKNIKPIVYDGLHLPFQLDAFDSLLLLTVLHHADDPEKLIIESKRVSKNIIIIEDTYKNKAQKWATQFVDLIVNFGHSKMTYQNKTEENWEKIFKKNELKVLSKRRRAVLFFFTQTTYKLEKLI